MITNLLGVISLPLKLSEMGGGGGGAAPGTTSHSYSAILCIHELIQIVWCLLK